MTNDEFEKKIQKCFKPIEEMVNDLYKVENCKKENEQLENTGYRTIPFEDIKKQMQVISSYAELKELKDGYGTLEIIPVKPIDYHDYLQSGYFGFNDKTERNYIFVIDKVDVDNATLDCHIVGHYNIQNKERCMYRCGNSVKCIWYLNVGEKYFYNVQTYPNEKYYEFIFTTTVIASKDVDQIRDNGGKNEHKDLSHPNRDDLKKRYNIKNIEKENRDDYKDTLLDPDLKSASEELIKVAKMLISGNMGRAWENEDKHIQMVQDGKFDTYLNAFMKYVNHAREQYYKKEFPNYECEPLIYKKSRSYVKIIQVQGGQQRSVWGFINMANGDLLKAAGWNAPAKHARGNIFEMNSWKGGFSPYGPTYLR